MTFTFTPWAITDPDDNDRVVDRFTTVWEAHEALLTGEYPENAEVAYVNEPVT